MDWAVSTIERILTQMPELDKSYIDQQVLIDAMQFTKVFENGNIDQSQIDILAVIFKNVIDPRSLSYIKLNSIINLLSVGFAYLWGIGSKNLALLLVSQVDQKPTDVMYINTTVNKSRIPQETKEKLNELFPYKRVINETTTANVAEETINELANQMFDKRWISSFPDKYLEDVIPDKNKASILPANLKIQLAEFIIENERIKSNV
jgi:hypothetical protein